MTVHVLGIRHHGPGSARSLRAALDELQPDAVLIEGPPDADALIPMVADAEMEPPVALLVYTPDDTQQAVYYPFAVFSPEMQAMQWAVSQGVHVQFMDLPQSQQFAIARAEAPSPPDPPQDERGGNDDAPIVVENPTAEAAPPPEPDFAEMVRRDPLGWLGRAAGYSDGERWWEHVIEQRRDDLSGVFEAVLAAMTELRDTAGTVLDEREAQREATMRKTIRAAQKAGYSNIAVVCGAWHGPALVEGTAHYRSAKDDNATLKGLPKVKVEATWIPWTYSRLSYDTGYGAGIESPGWYDHLWHTESDVVIRWLTKVAKHLRGEDLDASTAQVIDTVRLVETLTAMRGYALPGLDEMNESIQATMVFGAQKPMDLIHTQLIVGERMGEVPSSAPMVPLARDLKATIKRLKGGRSKTNGSFFGQDAERTPLSLDLRKETHLERSHLLHRLRVMGIPWGKPKRESVRSKGTFHEDWYLQWKPDFEIQLIERSVWGNTVHEAASAYVIDQAKTAPDLPALTRLVDSALNADLPAATSTLIEQLQQKAALATDVTALMDALPPLVDVLRYGSVRQIDADALGSVVEGLVQRITIGLPNACASLDDDAADAMFRRIIATHQAVMNLQNAEYAAAWVDAQKRLTASKTVHGLVAGRAARHLLDMGELKSSDVSTLMRLAISTASEPKQAAAWVEGFLRQSGLILLHDDALFDVIDRWLLSLDERTFRALLPLVRRTFASFSKPERRQLGERVRHYIPQAAPAGAPAPESDLDDKRADAVFDVIGQLLGLDE